MSDERKIDELLRKDAVERLGFFMPCYAFFDVDEYIQLEKIYDEMAEVRKALNDYDRDLTRETREELLMECADVQVAVETLMMQLGADEDERWSARRKVWEKNNVRGYYDEKVDGERN